VRIARPGDESYIRSGRLFIISAVSPSVDRCRSSRPTAEKEACRPIKMMRQSREEWLADSLLTFFPGATRLITRCHPAFDRGAWVHCLRQWKAAAFSCLSLEQGVISDGTRKTRSSPARGKALTRDRSILQLDRPDYDALSAATRHPYEKVPLFAISIRKTRYGSET